MEIYDWDFVYVMTNKVVNQRLKNFLNQNVVTFVYQNTDGTNIYLDFKEWRIVDGGSNKLLRLALNVEAGTITGGLNGSLNGICPEIEVNLDTLTQTTKSDVNIINLDVNGVLDSKKTSYYVIKSYMEELFNFNKDNIGKVLASLLYSPTEPWLTPVNYKFAYYAATNQEDEYFVTFAVVTERDISQLKTALDSNLLDHVNNEYILLSQKYFLEYFILPSCQEKILPIIKGILSDEKQFYVQPTSTSTGVITLTDYPIFIFQRGALCIQETPFEDPTCIPYLFELSFDNLYADIENNNLRISIQGKADCYVDYAELTFKLVDEFLFVFDRNSRSIYFDKTTSSPQISTDHKGNSKMLYILENLTVTLPWYILNVLQQQLIPQIKHTLSNNLINSAIPNEVGLDVNFYIKNKLN
ncbi:hypothetical protein A5816_002914 [Enterococcus sp. 3G1_DIV0629]|uniref:TULIP family P47-like protein n=1 Tax=Enterococcus sp. (strain 3G1_DIV0629) TaxID=1834176 RepID=UPI000A34C4FD|nr:TULIP family P47-like protein [Enterococcus sp. 3G1_DIV0629]OTO22242.1 hypothetical protein A5816_002914 [Enterococcus sp. 3G1_DIV0629]